MDIIRSRIFQMRTSKNENENENKNENEEDEDESIETFSRDDVMNEIIIRHIIERSRISRKRYEIERKCQ